MEYFQTKVEELGNTLGERSADFDSLDLRESKTALRLIIRKINSILKNRGDL